MIRKTLGYILSIAGIVLLALTFDPIKNAVKIQLPAFATTTILTIVAVILVLPGIFLILSSGKSSRKSKGEVPIYEGKRIVGYRRQ